MAAPTQIKAAVIGFARVDCPICYGRGRRGWDLKYNDKHHVIPCDCIEFMDLDTVREAATQGEGENEESQNSQNEVRPVQEEVPASGEQEATQTGATLTTIN